MHNFTWQHVRTFPLYILLRRGIDAFRSEGIKKYWPWDNETFWTPNITEEKSPKTLVLYEVFTHNYLFQNVSIPPNHILLRQTKIIFTASARFYYLSNWAVKFGFIPFFHLVWYLIYIMPFFKVTPSGNSSSISIKILVWSYFSISIISLILPNSLSSI